MFIRPKEGWVAILIVTVLAVLITAGIGHCAEIDVDWLVDKIIMAESSGDPRAVGDGGKARGLGQLTKATWERYTSESWDKAFDPVLNRDITTLRVMHIISKYNATDPAFVAKVYNCGDHSKLSFAEWKRRQPNRTYRTLYV